MFQTIFSRLAEPRGKMRHFLVIFAAVLATSIAQECIPDDERVDCHPDVGANEARCLQRGCTWCKESIPGRNTPTCFFPRNYGYKMTGEPVNTGHGYRVQLEKTTTTTLFGGDATTLTLEVDFQADYRLRVKITDDKPRWEVPIPIDPPARNLTNNPLYDFEFINDPVFSFKVIRRSSGAILFDSSLGGFTFSDQFILLAFKLPSKDVYGIGENEQHSLRQNFENRPQYPLFASGLFPDGNKNLYGTQPQYTVLEEDGNAHTVVIVNSNAQEIEMHPNPGMVYKTIGGILDMYFFLGPTPEETSIQYSEAIGRFPMPPYWALGFHLCRFGYDNITTMQATVDRMIASEIPYDVQYGDIDIMDRRLDFTVSEENFPGLNDYVKELKKKGIKFMTILDPCISSVEPNGTYRPFELGQEMDVWVKRADGKTPLHGRMWPDGTVYFPDYSKKSTQEWWRLMIKEFHDNTLEFDGLWIDMNEPHNFVAGDEQGCADNVLNNPPFYPKSLRDQKLNDNTLCPDAVDSLSTHYNTHNIYGYFESEPTFSGTNAAVGKRSFVLSRSNFIGSGRYVTHWLGDNYSTWENMFYSIIGVLQYQLFAMPFVGPDICGHQRDAELELCQRWHQLGAFYPYSRNHNANGQREQDPAAFDGKIIESTKKALLVRYTLLPYLYGLLARHEKWGETVVRPMWNLYPKDSVARGIDKQFFWGSTVMVTPVLEQGKTTVAAYFPDERFYDYYTGEEVGVRGDWTELNAPLEHINVHVHGGNAIATQEPAVNTDISRKNPFGLIVALNDNGEAEGSFFWDDGESFNTMVTGYYFIALLNASNNTVTYQSWRNTYPAMSQHKVDTIRILGVKMTPTRITVNGVDHTNFTVLPSKEVFLRGLNHTANEDLVLQYE